MAYRFKRGESIGEGVIRITCEQTELAIELLHGRGGVSPDEAVHESRKSIKRLRALFRLVRDEMGDAFDTANARLHQTGRKLSAIRDAGALIDAFDELRRDGKENLGKRSF